MILNHPLASFHLATYCNKNVFSRIASIQLKGQDLMTPEELEEPAQLQADLEKHSTVNSK